MVETTLFKMDHLGLDIPVVKATGTAPIAPVIGDDKNMMGLANDMIIYGSDVYLEVDGELDVNPIPSLCSPEYGIPFMKIFKRAGYDFYKIDPGIFAPAKVTAKNRITGRLKSAGRINTKLIEKGTGDA